MDQPHHGYPVLRVVDLEGFWSCNVGASHLVARVRSTLRALGIRLGMRYHSWNFRIRDRKKQEMSVALKVQAWAWRFLSWLRRDEYFAEEDGECCEVNDEQ